MNLFSLFYLHYENTKKLEIIYFKLYFRLIFYSINKD